MNNASHAEPTPRRSAKTCRNDNTATDLCTTHCVTDVAGTAALDTAGRDTFSRRKSDTQQPLPCERLAQRLNDHCNALTAANARRPEGVLLAERA